jgi:signal transduction histidine kinase
MLGHTKHPQFLGRPGQDCWAEIWHIIGPMMEQVIETGEATWSEDLFLLMNRSGYLEETYFTFSYSPIRDDLGQTSGIFNACTETTARVLADRRMRMLRQMAIEARTANDAVRQCAEILGRNARDIPFALFYLLADDGELQLSAQTGLAPGAPVSPAAVRLVPSDDAAWPLARVARQGRPELVEDLARRFDALPSEPWGEPAQRAMVLPIARPGRDQPAGVLVLGISPRRAFDDDYRGFFELVASHVATAVSNARAHEEQRARAEMLAELDRAKTTFFSNVSHEFRTPLTLILSPLEDALADRAGLPAAQRERLETVLRNSLRLLRLVNALLDFSRIEAGRLHAAYQPLDLAAETVQLAGMFRSAIESAGLTLTIDCPPLPQPVCVDLEMWEKIVLNLLSNALKHTATGGIAVAQHWENHRVTLRVMDTGIGIAAHELPRVFERFHRVQGAWSRSHEGTGIGLSLVRELARALGGDVEIASTEGVGTVVTVVVKTTAHLASEPVQASPERTSSRLRAGFVEEAMQWTQPLRSTQSAGRPALPDATPDGASRDLGRERPRIVWADDNADMREYVTRLLADQFDVVSAPDGAAALAAVRERMPDLVLSDVMMPNLDGVGLLAALRADPRTRTVPVILISARAGAEAAAEGMDAGADDYLIKPFAARELVSRVRTHIALAQYRRAWASELERANKELEAFSYSVSHDLRGPLRAIDGFSQILLLEHAHALDVAGSDLLAQIRTHARRMGAIIDDLLALAKVGRGELQREPINLTQIARRIVNILRLREPARIVDVHVPDDLSAVGDGRLVTIALENLLTNAWKFTSKRPRAEIAIVPENDGVIAVRDNGAGFDMSHSAHLFEPFQRLHSSDEFEGTGIGLAIVRRVIERHGGRVWAHGMVDQGATVRFTLGPGGLASCANSQAAGNVT